MEDFEKSQVILVNYKEFYTKSLDPSLTPHVSIAPNHPSVDPYHIDDQILREMNAADYCDWVRFTVRKMKVFGGGIYSAILHNKFLVMNTITNISQAERMGVSKVTFYRKLHHAERIFGKIMNEKVLTHLYGMADKKCTH